MQRAPRGSQLNTKQKRVGAYSREREREGEPGGRAKKTTDGADEMRGGLRGAGEPVATTKKTPNNEKVGTAEDRQQEPLIRAEKEAPQNHPVQKTTAKFCIHTLSTTPSPSHLRLTETLQNYFQCADGQHGAVPPRTYETLRAVQAL